MIVFFIQNELLIWAKALQPLFCPVFLTILAPIRLYHEGSHMQ
jgi:hypothetical protein